MPKRKIRSVDQLKANNQRLNDLMGEIHTIQDSRLNRRASIIAGQQQLESISINLEETLKKQELNLDKFIKLTYV